MTRRPFCMESRGSNFLADASVHLCKTAVVVLLLVIEHYIWCFWHCPIFADFLKNFKSIFIGLFCLKFPVCLTVTSQCVQMQVKNGRFIPTRPFTKMLLGTLLLVAATYKWGSWHVLIFVDFLNFFSNFFEVVKFLVFPPPCGLPCRKNSKNANDFYAVHFQCHGLIVGKIPFYPWLSCSLCPIS